MEIEMKAHASNMQAFKRQPVRHHRVMEGRRNGRCDSNGTFMSLTGHHTTHNKVLLGQRGRWCQAAS